MFHILLRKLRSQYKSLAISVLFISAILIITGIPKLNFDSYVSIFKTRTKDIKKPSPKTLLGIRQQGKDGTKLIYLETKYHGKDWSESYYFFSKNRDKFLSENCLVYNCRVTRDKSELDASDALLFHVRDITILNLVQRRKPNQIWILYSLEPPWLEILDWKKLDGLFNWTMSYRLNSSVPMKHGYYRRKEDTEMLSVMKHTERNGAVWFVSNCHSESHREDYVRKLKSYFPVDIMGGCGMDTCRPANSKQCYTKIEKTYKFYLSFENSICTEYVTEKLFEVLQYYVVPVVFGGANYTSIAPPGSFINAMDYPSPQSLATYLWKVSNDDNLYESFFNWKNNYEVLSYPWMCHLCEKLHNVIPGTVSIIRNLSNWWIDESGCKQWDYKEERFSFVNSNTLPRYNSRDFIN